MAPLRLGSGDGAALWSALHRGPGSVYPVVSLSCPEAVLVPHHITHGVCVVSEIPFNGRVSIF